MSSADYVRRQVEVESELLFLLRELENETGRRYLLEIQHRPDVIPWVVEMTRSKPWRDSVLNNVQIRSREISALAEMERLLLPLEDKEHQVAGLHIRRERLDGTDIDPERAIAVTLLVFRVTAG